MGKDKSQNFFIENNNTDPRYNLAIEQFVFESLRKDNSFFMLWRNNNSVIVGKNQNTMAEVNAAYAKEKNISVIRRQSGGGAVYHDLGNINYTFISGSNEKSKIDFPFFCEPVKNALNHFGVPAEISGRNDMTVNGLKISGNAQFIKNGRVLHHGTLLYDSNLDELSNVLNSDNSKFESKGIKSIKSRVTNIRPFMKEDMPAEIFLNKLSKYLSDVLNLSEYILSSDELIEIENIKERVYSQWSWNYGASPPCNIRKIHRVENCGSIEILLDTGKNGVINNIYFFGDFFGQIDTCGLSEILHGHHYELNEIKTSINNIDISKYFNNIDIDTFLKILFD